MMSIAFPTSRGLPGIPWRLLLFFCLAFSLLAGASDAKAQNRKLRVVTTVSMLADAARAIGGERIEVSSLLGEGVDPHTYRPTRADIARLTAADYVIANGLHLEAQLNETIKSLSKKKTILFAAEKIPANRLLADADYPDRKDPHVWMDPELWKLVASAIRDGLSERDPAGSALFEKGAQNYAAELDRLHAYSKKLMNAVPKESRVLITAHDAFNYFGRAYEFEVEGIQGLSTESEAGLKRIEELVQLVVSRKVNAVFVESSVPERNVRALVEGANARKHKLAIGGELYSDALGAPGTYEGTVVGMLDHNATIIARAFGVETPARGMQGKLKP
jgi:manganese/zinc/iron transport system substrate-binding protein